MRVMKRFQKINRSRADFHNLKKKIKNKIKETVRAFQKIWRINSSKQTVINEKSKFCWENKLAKIEIMLKSEYGFMVKDIKGNYLEEITGVNWMLKAITEVN